MYVHIMEPRLDYFIRKRDLEGQYMKRCITDRSRGLAVGVGNEYCMEVRALSDEQHFELLSSVRSVNHTFQPEVVLHHQDVFENIAHS